MEIVTQTDPHRNSRPEARRIDMQIVVSDVVMHAQGGGKALLVAQRGLYEKWNRWTDGLNVMHQELLTIREEARLETVLRLRAELSPPATFSDDLSVQISSVTSGFQAAMTHAAQTISQVHQVMGQNLGAALNTQVNDSISDIRRTNTYSYNTYKRDKNRP